MTAVTILVLTSVVSAQRGQTYKGRLSPVPVDAANQASTTGTGTVTAVLTDMKLSVNGTFSGLQGAATIAQIHIGPRGISGPPALDLTVTKATSGTVQGELTLTAAQVDHLKRGRLYVQIHSEKAPDGNLRGWLLP
jgi:hypothetical protein